MKKLQLGDVLIIKENNSRTPMKIEVLDVTKETYVFANLDAPKENELNYPSHKSILVERLFEDFASMKLSMPKKLYNPSNLFSCWRIEISEFERSYKIVEEMPEYKLNLEALISAKKEFFEEEAKRFEETRNKPKN